MLVSVDSSSTTETSLSIIAHTLSTSGTTRSSRTTDGEVTETLTKSMVKTKGRRTLKRTVHVTRWQWRGQRTAKTVTVQ